MLKKLIVITALVASSQVMALSVTNGTSPSAGSTLITPSAIPNASSYYCTFTNQRGTGCTAPVVVTTAATTLSAAANELSSLASVTEARTVSLTPVAYTEVVAATPGTTISTLPAPISAAVPRGATPAPASL